MIRARVDGATLNMALSSSNALGFIFGPNKLTINIVIRVCKNDRPIQIKKRMPQDHSDRLYKGLFHDQTKLLHNY